MKKILALILAVLMIIVPVYADESKVADIDSEEAKLLFTLKIMDETLYKPEALITRGDFASAVANVIGLYGMTDKCDTSFSDVTKESKNSGAIKLLSDMGVINGYGDGTFGESNTLKAEQAVKILMSALGYGVISESYGGYPSGYLVCATTAGLLKGVKIGDYEECSWEVAAKLLYNALFVDIVKDENGEQKTLTDTNSLNLYHDAQKYKGVVSGNSVTGIGGSASAEGYVVIGGETFKDPDNLCDTYFGQKVEIYHKNLYDEKVIIVANPDDMNTVTMISPDDISSKSSSEVFYYNEKDELKRVAIKGDAAVIYNGKFLKYGVSANDFNINAGNIKLIDNTGDRVCDIVFIESAEIYVVEAINTTRLTIEDMYNMPQISLDREESGFKYRILWDGIEVPFSEIVKGSVLSVLKSTDGLYVEIHICANRVRGTVTERNEKSISVDGVSYEILKGYESRVSNIAIDTTVTFFLNQHGKIAGCSKADLAGNYGYLIDAGPAGSGMADKDAGLFRIFSLDDGSIKNYRTSSDITLNFGGTEITEKLTGREIVQKVYDGDKIKRQLIKFELDPNGDILKLYTAKKNTSNPKGFDDVNFSLDFDYPDTNNPMPGWNYLIYSDSGVISNRYLTAGAVCISVPSENADGSINEKNIHMFNINEYPDSETITKFKVYDSDESRNIGVFVLEGGKGGLMPDDNLFIIESYGKGVTEEGNVVERLYGYEKGELKGYNISATSQMTQTDKTLCKGDAVKLIKDETGILQIVKLFAIDPTNAKGSYKITAKYYDDWVKYLASTEYIKNNVSYWHQKSVILHARPTFASKSTLLISFENGAQDKVLPLTSSTKIVCYDVATGEFEQGTWEDIEPNNRKQTVLVQVSYQEAYDILVINWNKNVEPIWKGSYNN